MPVPHTSPPRVLLVEGPDDKHVVAHLCRNDALMPELPILDKGGISPLLKAIEAEVMAPSREAVGIMVDANDSPGNRWLAVANQLRKAGVNAPGQGARLACRSGGTAQDGFGNRSRRPERQRA